MKLPSRTGGVKTVVSDAVIALVVVAGMPLWIVLLLGYAVVIVVRHVYWWARGNTTRTPASKATEARTW